MRLNPAIPVHGVSLSSLSQQATGYGGITFFGRDIGRKEVDFREKGQGEFSAIVVIVIIIFACLAIWRMNTRDRIRQPKQKPKSDEPVL